MKKQKYQKVNVDEHDSILVNPKLSCFGQKLLYSEVFLMGVTASGICCLLMSPFIKLPYMINGATNLLACGIGWSLVRTLANNKHIVAFHEKAAGVIAQDFEYFNQMEDESFEVPILNNEEPRVFDSEVDSPQVPQKCTEEQKQEIVSESEDDRQALSMRLVQQMERLGDRAIRLARTRFKKRAIMYFKAADNEEKLGIEVGGREWKMLEKLMSENGIMLDEITAGCKHRRMDFIEFKEFIQDAFESQCAKHQAAGAPRKLD